MVLQEVGYSTDRRETPRSAIWIAVPIHYLILVNHHLILCLIQLMDVEGIRWLHNFLEGWNRPLDYWWSLESFFCWTDELRFWLSIWSDHNFRLTLRDNNLAVSILLFFAWSQFRRHFEVWERILTICATFFSLKLRIQRRLRWDCRYNLFSLDQTNRKIFVASPIQLVHLVIFTTILELFVKYSHLLLLSRCHLQKHRNIPMGLWLQFTWIFLIWRIKQINRAVIQTLLFSIVISFLRTQPLTWLMPFSKFMLK